MADPTSDTESTDPQAPIPEKRKSERFTPAQEQEAADLLKELLLAGNDLPATVDRLCAFPWSVGVTALSGAWPGMTAEARTEVLGSLSGQNSEQARRMRLSIARGLAAVDPEATEKIATDVCNEMRAEGALSPKNQQAFANVFIGKGKPWLLHLPVRDWKEPQSVIACAVETCFTGPCPPFTQMALLGWLGSGGLFDKVPEESMALITKAMERWSPRWRRELRRELPEPPPAIEAALGAEKAEPEPAESAREMAGGEDAAGATESAVERMVASTRAERAAPRRERGEPSREFDLPTALRQIDSHVASLRRELQEAKGALRSREGGGGRGRSRRAEPQSEGGGDESLQRHNAQLEATIAELRERLEELASDHEDHAASMHGHDADGRAQFAELLALKLRESFTEFQTLRVNAADEVVRQHFGDMLEAIFKILEEEGVPLRP